MVVYKISNDFNDKVYIGATIRDIEDRWKEHIYCGEIGYNYERSKLYREMYDYGVDRFNISILKECVSYKELYDTETYYIQKYDAVEYGYNYMHCSPTRDDWEEFYRNMRESMTDDVKHRISESMKRYRQENGFSDTHRARLSKAALGNKNGMNNPSHSIPCYCIVDDNVTYHFKNYKEAGVWWYENYHPFGEKYSQVTYQRKIIDCIDKGYCKFNGNMCNTEYIKWFREVGDVK